MQKNLGGMLKGITQLQAKMEAMQKELGETNFEGVAANGLVKVVISGKGELKFLHIDKTAMTEDNETVAALVSVAFNKAYEQKELTSKEKLSKMSAGLLPLGMKIPGLG